MQRFLKIVFWSSIILLCFWILTAILGIFLPVEFANEDSRLIIESTRGFSFPIAVLGTLTGTLKRKDTKGDFLIKIVLTIIAAVFSFYIIALYALGNLCSYTTSSVFFENKQNSSIKIVERSFGCGAVDGLPSSLHVHKVREISPYLIWVTNIDTNTINKDEWIRIKNPEP